MVTDGESMKINLSIRKKINITLATVLVVGFIVTGFLTIIKVKTSVSDEITKQLVAQTDAIHSFVYATDSSKNNLEKNLITDAETELRTKIILINNGIKSLTNAYDLTDMEEEKIVKRLLMNVKRTTFKNKDTFLFVLDKAGTILQHPKAEMIGKSISNKAYIQKILKQKKGQVRYEENGITNYAVFRHNRDFNWYIILKTPELEIIKNSQKLESELIGSIKDNIKRIKIGITGYFYVMDSKGNLIVHPTSQGKNISKYDFIQEIMKKKTGVIQYPWEGEDKIVAYKYYKDRDWIIAGGSYLNEFIGPTMKDIISRFIITSLIVVFSGIALLSGLFITNVLRPLKQLENLFQQIADGDMTGKIEDYGKNEIGNIIEHSGTMVSQINNAIQNVSHSSEQVHHSAKQMFDASDEVMKGADDQEQQVSQVEVAIHEMTATIQEITMNVEEVTTEVDQIKEAASTGGEILEETVGSIQSLSTAVISTAENIKELGRSSESIGEILQVISDIADQTNLLALNAAIEAARAGEHGRGFAVVADEVRKLAERTVSATSEIDGKIKSIQTEVTQSVSEMDSGVSLAEEGSMMVGNLKMSLEEIINGVIDIANKISSIAAAVEEQSATSQEISNNMSDIGIVAQQSSQRAANNNSESSKLMGLADELTAIVNQFKLK